MCLRIPMASWRILPIKRARSLHIIAMCFAASVRGLLKPIMFHHDSLLPGRLQSARMFYNSITTPSIASWISPQNR